MIPQYEHTQKGGFWFYVCLVITLSLIPVLFIMRFYSSSQEMTREDQIGWWIGYFSLGITIPLMVWSTAMLYSLNVRIDNEFVHIVFGPWAFRKKYPLNRIMDCRLTESNLIHGWGIHMYKNGWIYNIRGFDAVEIELDSGKKIAIGTDEPKKLAEAIQSAIGQMPTEAV